jgi:CRP-like cAMP-binding protein
VSKASDNLLLAGLAPRDRRALFDDARPVPLQAGAMLAEAGNPLEHAYFPFDSSISLSVSVAGKQPSVVGLVGCEGMLGVPLILGSSTSGFSARVQGAGQAWQIEAPKFIAALADCAALRTLMNRYVHVHLLQMALSAACRSSHRMEGRLARWLLMSRDRAHSEQISLTHERLAGLLGVRRAGVTLAASSLQERALIRYTRGHVLVLDGRGLEAVACACYAGEKQVYARFMG